MSFPRISFDIETGKNKNYERFMPHFEEPKTKAAKSADEKREEWIAKCCLNPLTSRIICITYGDGVSVTGLFEDEMPEEKLLESFWIKYHEPRKHYLVGWNIEDFDLWQIYQRSLILGLNPSINPIEFRWNMCIDLMKVWNRGKYKGFTGLEDAVKALGIGVKNSEIGEQFEMYWDNRREEAKKYAMDDADLEYRVSLKLLGPP